MQEEDRVKQDKVESAHLVATSNDKRKNNKRKKDKEAMGMTLQKRHKEQYDDQGLFCGAAGHKKKQIFKCGVRRTVYFLIWIVQRLI